MKHLLRSIVLLTVLFSAGRLSAQCQAAFTYTNAGNNFTFTDASTASSGTVTTWLWNFGDLTAPSTVQNPQHTYAACGQYIVTLNIITSTFCTSSFSDTILVNGGTNPSFTANVDTVTGNVNFQAQPASLALTYNWTFGDSTTGTGVAVAHQYASSGTYNVCLVVADTAGICSDTICDTVVVNIALPSCNATFTNNPVLNVQTFTATPANFNWTYTWDYGDGSPTANGIITTHTYGTPGTYTVCLTIVDSSTSCTSTFCDTVIIPAQTSCPVTFTNLNLGLIQTFTASPLSIFNTYSWDFGDGSPFGTGTVATHTYATPGTYTVCVTMTTPQNCTSTFCDTVQIQPNGINDYAAKQMNLELYPNPAQDYTVIGFDLTAPGTVSVLVYDVLGKQILEVSRERMNAGKQTLTLPLDKLSPGAYTLRVITEGQTATTQLVRF
ncbi:MAG: PKD domain containing protein [Bacteroidetes bacterium]|nr:MAG: PKD domain containing protein [Bacteroidota bacterium]